MAIVQSLERVKELNTRLADVLKTKGVKASSEETTTTLINKVNQISAMNVLADLEDNFTARIYINYNDTDYVATLEDFIPKEIPLMADIEGSTYPMITSKYYPACSSSAAGLTAGFSGIGVSLTWALQVRIAEKNGFENYTGTADQNTQMLNMLKAGTLLNPDYLEVRDTAYYSACSSTCTGLTDGFSSIGITLTWELQVRIAEVNNISNYTGTTDQNNRLFSMLRAGVLIDPDKIDAGYEATEVNEYYSKCSWDCDTLETGLNEILGIAPNDILLSNLVTQYGLTWKSTETQKLYVLSLLKTGRLLNPYYYNASPPGKLTTKYFPLLNSSEYSSSTTLWSKMVTIVGTTCAESDLVTIATANNLTYSSSSDRNTQIDTLLQSGNLLYPNYTAPAAQTYTTQYFPTCDPTSYTVADAFESIGITATDDYITTVKNFNNFTGTDAEFITLFKQGLVLNPDYVEPEVPIAGYYIELLECTDEVLANDLTLWNFTKQDDNTYLISSASTQSTPKGESCNSYYLDGYTYSELVDEGVAVYPLAVPYFSDDLERYKWYIESVENGYELRSKIWYTDQQLRRYGCVGQAETVYTLSLTPDNLRNISTIILEKVEV